MAVKCQAMDAVYDYRHQSCQKVTLGIGRRKMEVKIL